MAPGSTADSQRFRYFLDGVSGSSLEGWALGPNGPCTVDVLVDGHVVGRATTGIPRPDVAAAYPGARGGDVAGFVYAFKAEDFGRSAGERAHVVVRFANASLTHDSEPVAIPRLRP